MAKKRELAGQEFGRLLVLYDIGERKNGKIVWHCRCDCGNEVEVIGCNLTFGRTKSCGCLQRQRTAEANTTHGMTQRGEKHPIYVVWRTMLRRCESPNHKTYHYYGARGIMVCDEWHEFIPFRDWAIENGWERGLQLNRVDNNGHYEPSNCNFVTPKENANNKRNNHLISFNGKTQTMAQWADELGINHKTLRSRFSTLRWSTEEALTTPVARRHHANNPNA